MGGKDGRHSEQDMKEALTHYQCSAGAYTFFSVRSHSNTAFILIPMLLLYAHSYSRNILEVAVVMIFRLN